MTSIAKRPLLQNVDFMLENKKNTIYLPRIQKTDNH